MLIDTKHSNSIELESFPNQIIIRVSFRQDYELEYNWDSSSIHGIEGVWYKSTDSQKDEIIELIPFDDDEPYGYKLYELNPKSCAPLNQCREHRFLVRSWDRDVYFPTINSQTISLQETRQDDGIYWSICVGRFSLEGIQFT